MLDPTTATVLILGVMGAVIVGFRLFIRRPKGLGGEDPAGLRTVVLFRGNDASLFADDEPEGTLVGVRLFAELCDGLGTAGLSLENRGTVQHAQRVECVAGHERFALVLERTKRLWVLGIEWAPVAAAERRHVALTHQVFSPPDSPELRQVLMAIDRWLKSRPELTDLAWHHKEAWIDEQTNDPADSPIEPAG